MVAVNVSMVTGHGGHRALVRIDDRTVETPPVEHALFYVGLAALAATEVIEWPLALVLMVGHVLLDATNRPGLESLGEALEEA